MVDKGETQQALDYIRGQIKKVRDAGEPDVTGLLENGTLSLLCLYSVTRQPVYLIYLSR